jgi:hypothetical protein
MSVDRLANEILDSMKKTGGDRLEVPVKLLFQILYRGQRANIEDLHKQLLAMKTKYKEIEYVAVMSRDPIVRFYKIKPKKDKETKLINMEEDDGRTTNSGTT